MELVFEDINIGDEVIDLLKPPITKVQLVRYAGASGDFNPLHTDDDVARAAGFDGVIAQGMLVMGIAAQAVTDWVPKRALKKFKVRFRGATRPGDIIRVLGKVKDKRVEDNKGIVVCTLEAADQNNDIKVLGSFETAFPI